MTDSSTNVSLPNPGKLSLAILEHMVEPVIGQNAINEIKLPVVEKELREALALTLERAERRFTNQHTDKQICDAVLSLPLANLPGVLQAVRTFYARPNDLELRHILVQQLREGFSSFSQERIEAGVNRYLEFIEGELVNLDADIRSKLATKAALSIQDNATRMAYTLDRMLDRMEADQTLHPTSKQFSKILTFSRIFGLSSNTTEDQAQEALREIARNIHRLLAYAFLDTCDTTSHQDFTYLLSLTLATNNDGSVALQLELICHITQFIKVFDELITTLFDKSDQEFLTRTRAYPSNLNIKMSYKWGLAIPYRISRVGITAIKIACLDSNVVAVQLPMQTSDLLVLMSAMINGKPVMFDDVDFSRLQPHEIELLNYIEAAKTQGINLTDFSLDSLNPESWSITTKGIQNRRRLNT